MFQQASMLGKRPISPKSEPMSPSNDDVSTVESSSNSSPLSPSSVDTAKDEEESRRQRLATGVYLSQRAQDRSTTHTLTTLQPMIITFVQEHRRTVAILWHSFAKQSTLDMVFNPNKVVWHFDHRRKHYAALMLTSYAFEYTLKKLRKWALRNGRGLTVPSTDGFPRATTCNVMCGVTMFEGQRDLDVNAPPSGTACLTLRRDAVSFVLPLLEVFDKGQMVHLEKQLRDSRVVLHKAKEDLTFDAIKIEAVKLSCVDGIIAAARRYDFKLLPEDNVNFDPWDLHSSHDERRDIRSDLPGYWTSSVPVPF
eukprot:CAMPEP_0173468500 /NCGR_PEP_ID=MMETSP1357-20121228/76883_1 /TAXON_ID=77926 /ORGANISM="Hemiselmis rufescens, Strain PCC563" /LENGTH=308 /DNA_ID=CAMNT_0014436721 /DNA_START=1591 /DNA_END=2517 /DNA_ORIENTATION=+